MDAEQYGEEAGLKDMNNISNINPAVFAKRKRANKIGLTLSMGAMGLGMIFLLWILSVLVFKGFQLWMSPYSRKAHRHPALKAAAWRMPLLGVYCWWVAVR